MFNIRQKWVHNPCNLSDGMAFIDGDETTRSPDSQIPFVSLIGYNFIKI